MKRTYLKFCSFALALVMTLATFAGTFAFTAVAATNYDSLTYSEWDGETFDMEWESAGEKAYYINSAAELAGLSKATYQAAVDGDVVADATAFYGVTFYITVNIDLNGHEWIPIGCIQNASKVTGPFSDITTTATVNRFGGSLIGMLGKVEGAAITIREFKMVAPFAVNGNAGLIGNHYAGDIKNITMYKPIATSSYNTLGFFAGYVRGMSDTATYPSNHVYENLTVVDGTLTGNASGDYTGAIVAYTNYNTTFRNCSVIDTTISGKRTIGGITGQATGSTNVFENCYVSGTISANQRGGGIVGVIGGSSNTFTNCQTDAILDGTGTQNGAFIGRLQGKTGTATTDTTADSGANSWSHDGTDPNAVIDVIVNKDKLTAPTSTNKWHTRTFTTDLDNVTTTNVVTFRNCVVTGVGGQTYGVNRNQAWVGTMAGTTGFATYAKISMDATNFSNADIPLLGNADLSNTTNRLSNYVAINSDTYTMMTSADQAPAYHPAVLSATSIDTLNANGTLWQQAAGESPVLKIGATATRTYAKADLSWFNPANYKDGFTITTNEQYLGLAMLSQLSKYSKTEYTYAIAKTVDTAAYADKFAAGFLTAIEPLVANKFADEGDLTLKVQVPAGATLEDETSKLRLVSALDAADVSKYTEVGFVLFVDGTTVAKLGTTTAYKTINGTANGMPVEFNATVFDKTADDYLFTAVIDEIPTEAFTTKLDIRVYAIEEDGTVVYGETYYDVTVKALIEALASAE